MWDLQFGDLKEGERFDPSIHDAAEKALSEHGDRDPQHAQARPGRRGRAASWTSTTRPGATTGASSRSPTRRSSFQAKNLKQILDEDWAFIAEKDGEVVGAALTLPDINQVMAKLNGRLLPFGWLQLPARQGARSTSCASSRSGVKPEYQHTGVAAGLYLKHLETAASPGAMKAARWAGSSRRTSR